MLPAGVVRRASWGGGGKLSRSEVRAAGGLPRQERRSV